MYQNYKIVIAFCLNYVVNWYHTIGRDSPLYTMVIEWTYQAEGAAAGDSVALEGVERTPEEAGHGAEPGSEEVGHDSEGVEPGSEEAGLESVVVVAWLVAALAAGTEEHWLEQAKERW